MDRSRQGWQPILTGEPAERAAAAVRAIAADLAAAESAPSPGAASGLPADEWPAHQGALASGDAGRALLFAYLALHDAGEAPAQSAAPAPAAADIALRLLDSAMDTMAAAPATASLYSGFPGVAWVNEHLAGRLFEQEGDPHAEVDTLLLRALSRRSWAGSYDLINGLTGLGIYALARLQRTGATACLDAVIERLLERAVRWDDAVEGGAAQAAWFTAPSALPDFQAASYPDGLYDLGVAHGIGGVIGLLGAVCAACAAGGGLGAPGAADGPSAAGAAGSQGAAAAATADADIAGNTGREAIASRARLLLGAAVRWLLAQETPDPGQLGEPGEPGEPGGYRFPHVLAPGVPRERCRIAWCYGDLGLAAALLVAARGAAEPEWEAAAMRLARAAAARPNRDAGVVDAALCHGAAGVGHLFNRLYQATGDEALAAASRHWLGVALAGRRPGRGIGGFRFWHVRSGDWQWVDATGFLEGAAGVALSLLAAISPVTPDWDQVLLASAPRPVRPSPASSHP